MNGLLAKDKQPMPDEAAEGQGGAPMAGNAYDSEGSDAETGGPDEDGEGESNVTPEEQAQYEQFIGAAMKLIYDPQTKDAVAKRLGATSDPMDDLANTAVMVVQRVQAAAEKEGETIDEAVLLHGGKEILEDLAEWSEQSKIHAFTDKELEGAWYRALDLYRTLAEESGQLDPTQLKAEFEQINQADQQGRLGEVLPGVDKMQMPADEAPADDEAAPAAPVRK